ncbi:MAG: metalloregulator ArsR/SmtB family transcription factor [Betaproteobacteria bacterium]|nr:metalloregulator ArsR/SmtB family transcription factor [Betaproteobacteria bacterium]
MKGLSPEALKEVAGYFQALSEPARLQLLNLLREGDCSVGELAELCGFTAANASRHLACLTREGLVEREGRGTNVYYRIADDSVYALCDLVCDSIARKIERAAGERRAFARARHATKRVAERTAKRTARK